MNINPAILQILLDQANLMHAQLEQMLKVYRELYAELTKEAPTPPTTDPHASRNPLRTST